MLNSVRFNQSINGKINLPDPEVLEKPVRRRFTAEYKLKIVEEADRCSEAGQVGGLLRREGLYSSQLSAWRHQRQQGQLQALRDDKRGRKVMIPPPIQAELEQLRRENQQLRHQVHQAELIIDIQKNCLRDSSRPIGRETKGITLSGIRTVTVGLLEVFPRKKTWSRESCGLNIGGVLYDPV